MPLPRLVPRYASPSRCCRSAASPAAAVQRRLFRGTACLGGRQRRQAAAAGCWLLPARLLGVSVAQRHGGPGGDGAGACVRGVPLCVWHSMAWHSIRGVPERPANTTTSLMRAGILAIHGTNTVARRLPFFCMPCLWPNTKCMPGALVLCAPGDPITTPVMFWHLNAWWCSLSLCACGRPSRSCCGPAAAPPLAAACPGRRPWRPCCCCGAPRTCPFAMPWRRRRGPGGRRPCRQGGGHAGGCQLALALHVFG